MVFYGYFRISDATKDFKEFPASECSKIISLESQQHQSPLTFFLKLCSYIFYVPFGVTWNKSTNLVTFTENNLQKFCCGIVHTLVFAYNIIILIDHIHNFNGISRSIISECFVLVCDFTATVLWLSFTKIVWFKKRQLECILNSLASNMFNGKQLALIKFIMIGMAIISLYQLYEYSYGSLQLLSETNTIHSNYQYTDKVSLWTSKHYILRIVQLYVLLFYFVWNSFIFALNCSILENAWKFQNELRAIGNHNLEKVCIVLLIQTQYANLKKFFAILIFC